MNEDIVTHEQLDLLHYNISRNGIDYTIRENSYPEINSVEFQKLRQSYIDSANNLENYLRSLS